MTVLYDVRGGVAVVTLNRPDRLNAWTTRMEKELEQCMRTAESDPSVRVIVLTGAGRGFCAGADMSALDGYARGEEYDLTSTGAVAEGRDDWSGAFSYLLGLAKPVIAAINGAAAGVGFVLMCFADIRFAAEGAKLTTSFGRLALPAEHGVSWMLPRLIGAGRAADLLYSSRVVLAEEAAQMGLVNRVFPADALIESTLAYAGDIADGIAPASLRMMKHQLWGDLLDPLASSWQAANAAMVAMLAQPDFAEGLAAFNEKRTPRFRDM